MKRNKFAATKTVIDGLTFDSKAEARRWVELQLLEKAGAINCLQRQVPFALVPGVKIKGEMRARPAVRWRADFVYREKGVQVIEDVKSKVTAKLETFRRTQHLMLAILGLEITVVIR